MFIEHLQGGILTKVICDPPFHFFAQLVHIFLAHIAEQLLMNIMLGTLNLIIR